MLRNLWSIIDTTPFAICMQLAIFAELKSETEICICDNKDTNLQTKEKTNFPFPTLPNIWPTFLA